jgi:hypothetical protein
MLGWPQPALNFMSSHHIIREDQEPAVLIMDAQAISFDLVQELLEWSPTVIVSEQALPEILLWGIKIDVVIAHETKIQELTSSLQDQFPLKLISFHDNGEALSTALYFLMASKQKAVNVLSFKPLTEFEKFSTLDISVFQEGKRWSFIREGLFEKWVPAGSVLQTHPVNDPIKTERDGIVTIRQEKGFWVSQE